MKFQKYINEVMTIKLMSGEEVIGKIVSETDDEIELSNPLSVAPNPQGMGLMPSLFTSSTDVVKLNTSNITMYAKTDENVALKYIEATSGIQIPSKKIVLG
jgi:adenosine deaminase